MNAIEAISTICTHPNIEKYPKTVSSYLDKILIMTDIFNSSQIIPNQVSDIFLIFPFEIAYF